MDPVDVKARVPIQLLWLDPTPVRARWFAAGLGGLKTQQEARKFLCVGLPEKGISSQGPP